MQHSAISGEDIRVKRNCDLDVAFCAFCLALAALKLLLISGEEIVARYQPLDDLWQILAASRGYWLGTDYNYSTFAHLPVYPLWIALTYFTGIPLRIATEVVYLLAAFAFASVLVRAGVGLAVGAICYGLLVFHPASFQLFNYALAETIYAPLLLLAMASLILLWLNRNSSGAPKYGILTGLFFGLLWCTRKESILIVATFAAYATAVTVWQMRHRHESPRLSKRLVVLILLPIAIVLTASLSVKAANWVRFGLFVSSDMDAPGYRAAYRALLRIRPEQSIRFVPVPREVREKAYAVSPAFKELEPLFEGEFGRVAASETKRWMGIEGEIAAGWFYWALRQAAAQTGHHGTAAEGDAYYHRIANEINLAIDDGRLKGRWVAADFLDPDPGNYIPHLGNSIVKMWHLFTSTNELPREKDDAATVPETVRRAFDIVANRRAALTGYQPNLLRGWVFHQRQAVRAVLLRAANGQILAKTEVFRSRPDVARSYSQMPGNKVPVNTGFELIVLEAPDQLARSTVVFVTSTGAEFSVPFSNISEGHPSVLGLSSRDSGDQVTYAFDSARAPKGSGAAQRAIQSAIWAIYGAMVGWLTILAVVAALYLAARYRSSKPPIDLLAVVGGLLFVVCSRVGLFALVDASSWPGDQARYLFPVMPMYTCVLMIVIGRGCSEVLSSFVRESKRDS